MHVGNELISQGRYRHVSQNDRASRRYRATHSDVFVVADEDEELGEPLSLHSLSAWLTVWHREPARVQLRGGGWPADGEHQSLLHWP